MSAADRPTRAGDPERLRLALGFAVLAALAVFCGARLRVQTEILHFVGSESGGERALLARELADSELTRTLVLSLEAPTAGEAGAALAALAAALEGRPEVAWLRTGPPADVADAVRELYFPRRLRFLSDRPEAELPERLSDEGLARAARELKAWLAGPAAPLVRALAPADPLLAFAGITRRLGELRAGALRVEDGRFVSEDGRHAILLLATRGSAFDTRSTAPLLAAIEREFERLNAASGGRLALEQGGVHRFALDAERRIRADTQRISALATLAVAALCLACFGSLRVLFVLSLPLIAGFLCATAAGILAFGELHGMTLAFGASLIGVCIDYPVHLAVHHALEPDRAGPRAALHRIGPGLALGAGTTLAGFAVLGTAGFPGIRELGLFASTGLVASFAATWLLVPPLLRRDLHATALARRLAGAGEGVVRRLVRARSAALATSALVALAAAAALSGLRWQDDLAALGPVDPRLAAEDARVRARVSSADLGRAVVAVGRDAEEALARNDAVALLVAEARDAGLLDGFDSLHALLWSAELQERNLAQVRRSPRLAERMAEALAREGFRPEAFEPFRAALAADPPALTLDDLAASPLGPLAAPFHAVIPGRVAVPTLLRGVRDGPALAGALAGLEGVHYLDQRAFLAESFGDLRRSTLSRVGLGLVGVLVVLALRYRRLSEIGAALLPATLASLAMLAVVVATGTPVNLLHVLALVLVLSIGVDYGVFLVESARSGRSLGTSALGVGLAGLTTLASFGLLATSSHPALHSLGVASGVGVLGSLLLAPVGVALLRPGRRGP
jgi:predicted exporter